MMTQRHPAASRYVHGLGYTADDAARAVTDSEKGQAADFYNQGLPLSQLKLNARSIGADQALYVASVYLPWLQSLLTSHQWSDAQKSLINNQINSIQGAMPLWKTQVTIHGDLIHQAGLLAVKEDASAIAAQIATDQQNLLNQLGAWADASVVNKYYADAAAAKAATDAVAAATDAAVRAGGTYIPPGVVLPDIFLPANVAKSAAAQLSLIQKNTGNTNVGVTPITGSGGTQTPQTQTTDSGNITDFLTSNIGTTGIPMWAAIAAGGAGLYFMTKGKR